MNVSYCGCANKNKEVVLLGKRNLFKNPAFVQNATFLINNADSFSHSTFIQPFILLQLTFKFDFGTNLNKLRSHSPHRVLVITLFFAK